MKRISQFVALLVVLLLGTMPLLAAIPCAAQSCAMEQHCACCCGGAMGEAAMAAPAVQAQAATAETPADAPCLCGDAAELSSSIQAEQPTAPQTAAVMRADSTLPIAMLLPAAPELRRDAAPRVPMDREPSFLGSFLI